MSERPILFSGAMVRAILEGRKTQTRRVVKPQPTVTDNGCPHWGTYDGRRMANVPRRAGGGSEVTMTDLIGDYCPYGKVGDYLWVRETWATVVTFNDTNPAACWKNERPPALWYRADTGAYLRSEWRGKWRPSIYMPRWASRITIEVVSVKVEKLHRIGEFSAKAEGVEPKPVVSVARGESYLSYCEAFTDLWDVINAKRGYPWESNPWVWVIEFKRAI